MATKSKNLSERILQIVFIPICAALFVGVLHFGLKALFVADESGFSQRLLRGGTYETSGELLYDMRNDFGMIMARSLEQPFYELEGEVPVNGSQETEETKNFQQLFQQKMTDSLNQLERYNLADNFQFYVKYRDLEYTSANYDPASKGKQKLVATIRCTPDGVETSGLLDGTSDEIYSYLENYMATKFYDIRNAEEMRQAPSEALTTEDLEIFIGYPADYVNQRTEAFDKAYEQLRENIMGAGLCLLGMLFLFVALCFITGKEGPDGHVVIGGVDRWPTELFLVAIALLLLAGAVLISEAIYSTQTYMTNSYGWGYYHSIDMGWNNLGYMAMLAGAWIVATAGLALILCLVRKIKAGQFLRTCLCVRIAAWVVTGLKEVYYGGSTMRKLILIILGSCLLCATVVSMPLVAGVLIVLAARNIRQYEEICHGIEEIRSGNTGYRIPVEGNPDGEMQKLAANVNDISEGFDLAVRKELKNQRMKSELISNVSHDLKTPMTSIITYIDLLKKEGLDSENAPKYLEILDEKSQRLKKLSEDLFEAAKASSGDMPVHLARVEMTSLVNQGLGEYQDRFNKKGFEVIFRSEQDKFFIMADGQLLWRVIENLFGNLLKYAMENTRIYLDLREEIDETDHRSYVALDVKNMSKYPLNIPADELMERFKRGDDSRSTEGSGLGLAIVRDLTTLQKGRFDLKVDGDLFKATVMFEQVK